MRFITSAVDRQWGSRQPEITMWEWTKCPHVQLTCPDSVTVPSYTKVRQHASCEVYCQPKRPHISRLSRLKAVLMICVTDAAFTCLGFSLRLSNNSDRGRKSESASTPHPHHSTHFTSFTTCCVFGVRLSLQSHYCVDSVQQTTVCVCVQYWFRCTCGVNVLEESHCCVDAVLLGTF